MQWLLSLGLALILFDCYANKAADEQLAAADQFTEEHQRHDLGAEVGGTDCRVLLIHAAMRLDDSLVESIQYGTEPYDALGGVEELMARRRFRAAVYRDPSGRLWTYGSTTRDEAKSMPRCR
jgi:hypothetical protein